MSKQELIKKLFDILMDGNTDNIDKLIDVYLLLKEEKENDAKLVKKSAPTKSKDIFEEIEGYKENVSDYKDLIDKIRDNIKKENKEECLFDRYKQRNGGKYTDNLLLHCPCKKCNPFTY